MKMYQQQPSVCSLFFKRGDFLCIVSSYQNNSSMEQISTLDPFILVGQDTRSMLRACLSVVYNASHPPSSNGSATSEDLFWKLDALQMFVLDLHWPEPEFAKHLEQRLKLMASDMMEACVKRFGLRGFHSWTSGFHVCLSSFSGFVFIFVPKVTPKIMNSFFNTYQASTNLSKLIPNLKVSQINKLI